MAKPLFDYSITAFEMQNLFRAKLNQDQIHYISIVVKTLAKYMVLDRNMLQARAGKSIGLSYIVNSVNVGLITELKYKTNEEEKNLFYFHLNTAGINFAQIEELLLNKLPLIADHYIKSRILTFNKWALENGYDLVNSTKGVSKKFDYFVAIRQDYKKQSICFFEDIIKEEDLVQKILEDGNAKVKEGQDPYTLSQIYGKYTFVKINHPIVQIGNKSCAPVRSELK
jgi:hypothetical protein